MAIEDVAVIGVAVETSGIEKGKKSLEDLAGVGVKVDNAMSKVGTATSGAAKGANELAGAANKTTTELNKQAATTDKAAQEMRKLELASQATANAQKRAGDSAASVATGFTAIGGAVKALALASAAQQFIQFADAATNVRARLGLVTSSAAELAIVQERLFNIAQASRVGFTDLATTYAQIARATKELGVSQSSLLGVTETISQALTISGASAASANAALVQLSQGLASGQLRGEELNSVLEQTPRLAQAIAEGLGLTTGQLREFAQTGQLTADKVLTALQKSAAGVAEEFAKIPPTVEGASVTLKNALGDAIGQFDQATGASTNFARSIIALSGAIKSLSGFLSENKEAVGIFVQSIPAVGALNRALFLLNEEQDKSAEAIKKQISQLEELNRRGPGIYNRSTEALEQYGASVRARTEEIAKLKDQLAGIQSASSKIDTRVEDFRLNEGLQERNKQEREAAASAAKLSEIRRQLSGVDKDYLPTLQELSNQYQSGNIKTEGEYVRLVTQLIEKNTKKVEGSKSVARAVAQEQSAYQSLIASINARIEAERLEIAGGDKLTESQKLRIKLEQDLLAGRLRLSQAGQASAKAALDELALLERRSAAQKASQKAAEDAADAQQKFTASLAKDNESIQAQIAQLDEQTARLGLTEVAIARLDAAKLEMLATDAEVRATGILDKELSEAQVILLREQAQAYRDLAKAKLENAGKRQTLDAEREAISAAKEVNREWERVADDINRSLTDALLRGFESGKDFAKNLRDTVINMFKTLVLRPIINAIVNPVGAALTGGLGFSGAAQAGQIPGLDLSSVSSGFNLIRNGVSDTIRSAFSNFATSSTGQSLGLSAVNPAGGLDAGGYVGSQPFNPAAPGAAQLTGLGETLSGAIGLLGQTIAGYGIANFISGGYSTGLGNAVNILGALGGPIGGVIAGVVNRLFGRKLKDFGIEGTFGGESGFEGRQFQFFQGGLLRSDKTRYSPLEESSRNLLADAFIQMRAQVGTFAEILGLGTDRLKDFTTSIKISTKGLNDEQINEKFAEALRTVNNELAQQVLGTFTRTYVDVAPPPDDAIFSRGRQVGGPEDQGLTRDPETGRFFREEYTPSEFARDGETAIETLTRLATSLTTANGIFETLGQNLFEASLQGADFASSLIDLFGGAENFTNAASAYLQNFYTEDERRQLARQQIDRQLTAAGIATPTDIASYRRLVEAQDLSTEAGRRAYAVLLQLAGAFAEVERSAEQAREAAREQARQRERQAVDDAFAVLQASIEREKKVIQARIDVARETVDQLSGIFDLITDNVRELRQEAIAESLTAASGRQFISQALVTAQTTGYLPEQDALSNAIDAARRGFGSENFATLEDQRFAQLVLAGELEALGRITGDQLTEAERMLKVSQDQLDALDAQLDYWQQQIDISRGELDATLSIADAIRALEAAILDSIAEPLPKPVGTETKPPAGGGATFGGSGPASPQEQSRFRRPVALGTAGVGYQNITDEATVSRLDALSAVAANFAGTGDIKGLLEAARAGGFSLQDLADQSGFFYQDWLRAAEAAGVPAFAKGTNYVPRDMLAVIHKGEAIVPKAYNPNLNGGNDQMAAMMANLTGEVIELRQQVEKGNIQSKRAADALNGEQAVPMIVEIVS